MNLYLENFIRRAPPFMGSSNHLKVFISIGSSSKNFFTYYKNFISINSFIVSPYPLEKLSKYKFFHDYPLRAYKCFFNHDACPSIQALRYIV